MLYMYCVCITKRFEGAISGVSVVTYIVCLYNSFTLMIIGSFCICFARCKCEEIKKL